ncbi:Panacea domain-containing protein [Curtobacterium sp. 9128]|uniref:Panacea domain-containing protein n=1 Tax=Curtobacterium sp. 9128 TaxID=1793722 RepID=UPI00119DA3C4|nr:Panacea domain-containing protein [Curtobacterium sp. 9128]
MTQQQHLADIVAYLCARYPHKSELSNARLTKLVYLADWRSVQDSGRQITDIDWVFNHYGPWVPDVVNVADHDSRFGVETGVNAYGSPRKTIVLKPEAARDAANRVDVRTATILDLVIAETRGMYFNPFIRYVYATLPVRITAKGSFLPLADIRNEHPESQVPLPRAVLTGVLSAEDYTAVRTELSQITAERLLDPAWGDRTDPPLTNLPPLAGLRVRRVSLWPDLVVEPHRQDLVISAVALCAADAEVAPRSPTPVGFQANADDSTPTVTALTTNLLTTIHASVTLPLRAGTMKLTSIRFAAPTASTEPATEHV